MQKSIAIFAHKIKNPLHAAVINLDVAKTKLKRQSVGGDAVSHLDIASSEIKRLERMVVRYLDFVRLSDAQRSKMNLEKYLDEA